MDNQSKTREKIKQELNKLQLKPLINIDKGKSSKYKKELIALAILIIGLILTFSATYYTYIYIETRTNKEFLLVCNEIKSKIEVKLHAHAQLLRSGAAYFETSDTITRQDWKEFIENNRIEKKLTWNTRCWIFIYCAKISIKTTCSEYKK